MKNRSTENKSSSNEQLNITALILVGASALVLIMIISMFFNTRPVFGQTMTSSHYKIQSDSINFGGGHSTSTGYVMEDTAGEIATGISSSTHYVMSAGYQQSDAVTLTLVPPTNVTMSPAIGGVVGGTADGSTNFTVTTNDNAGYHVTIQASSSPALQGPYGTFADYTPAGANPDFTFSIAASDSEFGFSPEGSDIQTRYKNDGNTCNTGSNTSNGCWDGLSTSPITFVSRASANMPSGTLTTLKFRAASGSSHIQPDGTYTATTTITVTAN